MISATLCAFMGAIQVLLLNKLLKAVLSGDFGKTLVCLFAKFVCYGAVFSVVYFFFKDELIYSAAGFTVGLIVALVIFLIKSKKQGHLTALGKGDDANEHSATD